MKRKKLVEKSLTVQEAYDQFQRYNLTKGLSEGTIRYYESYSRAFFKFLGDTSQPLAEVMKDTLEQWQTVLDAVRLLAEIDDLEEMILDAKAPSGGFLSVQDLRTLLNSIQAAVEAKRQEAHVSPCEAAAPEEEALPPEKP